MTLKLDMEKAYDRVEWICLLVGLLKMGFHDMFVSQIIQRITTPAYKFNLNGEIVGNIKPSKGLRQGDPLSLCLFILCVEGLSGFWIKPKNKEQYKELV